MNLKKLAEELEAAARESDPENAGRLLLVYVSPANGIIVFRPGRPFAQLGGDDVDVNVSNEIEAAVDALWPEATTSTRQWLIMIGHAAGRGAFSKLLGG
jgi:hypothetical protein